MQRGAAAYLQNAFFNQVYSQSRSAGLIFEQLIGFVILHSET